MPTQKELRKKAEQHYLRMTDRMDPTGSNRKKYEKIFKEMSDKEFDTFMRRLDTEEDFHTYIEMVEYEIPITIENIMKAAEEGNIPLFEEVIIPYLSNDPDNAFVTPQKVPVGYMPIRRLPQSVMKKSAGSTSITQRSQLTGQSTGADKNARNTNLETYSLLALGANKALEEFMGPRADDKKAKDQMYNAIAKNGYVSLDEIETNDPYNKIALNTYDVYYLLGGITTNLVTELDKIPGPK